MITTEQIQKGNILIIDDEPANVMVLEETLSQAGFTSIKSITDPRKALETYNSFEPDLMLLDLNMPHLDGFQVMEQIKEADARSKIPIMVLTAQADQATRLRALDAGARDFLTKPFDILEVSLRIQNMLEVSLLYKQFRKSNNSLEKEHEKAIFDLEETKIQLGKEVSRRKELEEQLNKLSKEKVENYFNE